MKELNKYLDKIKAEPELKEKTLSYIKMKSVKQNCKKNRVQNILEEIFIMKKFAGAILSITFLGLVALGGFKVYNNPVAYISMDINPSVELGLNFMNKVVSVEGVNEDGKALIEEANISNMAAEDAVEILVQEANNQGYINEDGSSVVALTAIAKNEKKSEQIEERIKARVEKINKEGSDFVIYADNGNIDLRKQAEEFNISPGKYRLILMLQDLDSSIDVESYVDSSVKDIMLKIHELKGIGLYKAELAKDQEKNSSMVEEAANQIINKEQKQINKNKPEIGNEEQINEPNIATEQKNIQEPQQVPQTIQMQDRALIK